MLAIRSGDVSIPSGPAEFALWRRDWVTRLLSHWAQELSQGLKGLCIFLFFSGYTTYNR